MPWVTFNQDFNWRSSKRGMRQFRKGQKVNVPLACAEAAEAAGKGKRSSKEADAADDTTSQTETPDVVLTETQEIDEDETPKRQSLIGKLTGTADREPG
ncbi:hypothetical protein D1227_06450 [Henriciella mobilis]|uniref:hypothetical protein n=1 Tax=Henriciella mobilis TaxID=2305467 RepID=UPI000E669B87|nr:hypothetical protein [Henriciella mobilis]RIJ15949.1 hypothetical protein D1231_09150 [Henriciella mobilis]RIJ21159.1 hypothetical protein D1227_12690 [Henriciella mobilis]RIJ23140.1 hypothetical protein D1227_06450 [Henriciella mobilis]